MNPIIKLEQDLLNLSLYEYATYEELFYLCYTYPPLTPVQLYEVKTEYCTDTLEDVTVCNCCNCYPEQDFDEYDGYFPDYDLYQWE